MNLTTDQLFLMREKESFIGLSGAVPNRSETRKRDCFMNRIERIVKVDHWHGWFGIKITDQQGNVDKPIPFFSERKEVIQAFIESLNNYQEQGVKLIFKK